MISLRDLRYPTGSVIALRDGRWPAVLAFCLSNRLREAELPTLINLGTSRSSLLVLTCFETSAVLLVSPALAAGLLTLLNALLPSLLQALLGCGRRRKTALIGAALRE